MEASTEEQRPGVLVENERGAAEDGSNQRLLYTIPGVLHFLQTECARMEAERAQFELERTELQARIAFLEGERRAQDNLKKDLVRRIRMLEHALAKEREKAVQSSNQSQNDENRSASKSENSDELTKFGVATQPVDDLGELLVNLGQTKSQKARSQMISEGRQLLRKYLQEIGYADTIVDVRSARVRALLGLEQTNQNVPGRPGMLNGAPSPLQSGNQTSGANRLPLQSDTGNAGKLRIADEVVYNAEQSVIDTFEFLRSADSGTNTISGPDDQSDGSMIPELRGVLHAKEGETADFTEEDKAALNELSGLLKNATVSTSGASRDQLTVRVPDTEFTGDGEDGNTTVISRGGDSSPRARTAATPQQSARPEVRFVLRSHYDAVRAVAFHPTEAALVSASDDSTVKLWSLDRQNQGSVTSAPSPHVRRSAQSISSTVVNDLEPLQTFRGHCSPLLCAALGSGGDRLYTGGLDGGLACYSLQSLLTGSTDIYDPWDSTRSLAYVENAHDDAIWQIATHPTRPSLLVSCGADAAIRLWNVGDANSSSTTDSDSEKESVGHATPVLLRVMSTNEKNAISSVDFSRVEYTQLIASATSTTSASLIVYDFETGGEIARVDNICTNCVINEVVAHPTLPLVALACDDGFIRLVDLAAAAAVFPASPVPDAVTVATLPTPAPVSSIAIDQTGVYLLAGCHDGSVRLWNLETRACLFDDTVAHHRKFDEGVLSVAVHPSRPLFASAGADGAVRVYRW